MKLVENNLEIEPTSSSSSSCINSFILCDAAAAGHSSSKLNTNRVHFEKFHDHFYKNQPGSLSPLLQSIHLENVSLDWGLFIHELNKINTSQLQFIILKNVFIELISKETGIKLIASLPSLKSFYVSTTGRNSNNLDLTSILFFEPQLNQLWARGFDIKIVFGPDIVFEMNHSEGLFYSRLEPETTKLILGSSTGVKKLCLHNAASIYDPQHEILLSNLYASLEFLELNDAGGSSWSNWESQLSKFEMLHEFVYTVVKPTGGNQEDGKSITIQTHKYPKNLKKLAIIGGVIQLSELDQATPNLLQLDYITFNDCHFSNSLTSNWGKLIQAKHIILIDNFTAVSLALLDSMLNSSKGLDWICVDQASFNHLSSGSELTALDDETSNKSSKKILKLLNEKFRVGWTSRFHIPGVTNTTAVFIGPKFNDNGDDTDDDDKYMMRLSFPEEVKFLLDKHLGFCSTIQEKSYIKTINTGGNEQNNYYTVTFESKTSGSLFAPKIYPRFSPSSLTSDEKSQVQKLILKSVKIHQEDFESIWSDLPLLVQLQLENVVGVKIETNTGLISDPEFKSYNGCFVPLDFLPKSLVGLSCKDSNVTKLNSSTRIELDSFFIKGKYVEGFLEDFSTHFNVKKQLGLWLDSDSMDSRLNHKQLGNILLNQPSLDTVFVAAFYNCATDGNNVYVTDFLQQLGLHGWETDFLLVKSLKKAELSWKGVFLSSSETYELFEVGYTFKKLEQNLDLMEFEHEQEEDDVDNTMLEFKRARMEAAEEDDQIKPIDFKLQPEPKKPIISADDQEETISHQDICNEPGFSTTKASDGTILLKFMGSDENDEINFDQINLPDSNNVTCVEMLDLPFTEVVKIFEILQQRHELVNNIKELRLINVELEDFLPKLEFPSLNKLILHAKGNNNDFVRQVTSNQTSFEQLLTFFKPTHLSLNQILDLNVDICFAIKKQIHFLNHKTKELLISGLTLQQDEGNKFKVPNVIFIDQTSLGHLEPPSLTSLRLSGQFTWEEMSKFLTQTPNLQTFQYEPSEWGQIINLDHLPTSLKELHLKAIRILDKPKLHPIKLKSFICSYCNFPEDFSQNVQAYFHTEHFICTNASGKGWDHVLLNNLINSGVTTWIYLPIIRTNDNPYKVQMEEFLTAANVATSSSCLILEKVGNEWKSVKLAEFSYSLWPELSSLNRLHPTFTSSKYFMEHGDPDLTNIQLNFNGFNSMVPAIRSITINSAVINTTTFWNELCKLNLNYLERLELKYIQLIGDFEGLKPLRMSGLKCFILQTSYSDRSKKAKSFKNLQSFIPFQIPGRGGGRSLGNLWDMKLNVFIQLGSDDTLIINHAQKKFASSLEDSNDLLCRGDDIELEILGLHSCIIPVAFPSSLKILDLQVNDDRFDYADFEKLAALSCPNLTELHWRTTHNDPFYLPTIRITTWLPSLKICNFVNVNIEFDPNLDCKAFDSISFNGCSFSDPNIDDNLTNFINPAEIGFYYGYGYSPAPDLYYNLISKTQVRLIYADQFYFHYAPNASEAMKEKMDPILCLLDSTKVDREGILWHPLLKMGIDGVWTGDVIEGITKFTTISYVFDFDEEEDVAGESSKSKF